MAQVSGTQFRAQFQTAARHLLADNFTVEELFDLVLAAARREFHCTITVTAPAELRVDGYTYRWPE